MSQLAVLTKKEFLQMGREYKLIWLPLVFILLGITQPLISYFLPQIFDSLGETQGITIDPTFMEQSGANVLADTLASQFNQLGVIFMVISMMMIVQADKETGMLAFILTKPIRKGTYITSKLIANYLVVAGSVGLGYYISYIYVNMYFTTIPVKHMFIAICLYFIWIFLITSFTMMMSTIFNSPAIIAILSICILLLWTMLTGMHPIIDIISPASMSTHALEMLVSGSTGPTFIWNLILTIGWIVFTLYITHWYLTKKKFNFHR